MRPTITVPRLDRKSPISGAFSPKAGYDMSEGPHVEWGSRETMLSSLDQSLSRLNVDYVDIFCSHRPDPKTPIEETMGP
ncbi:hypothetical protein MSAR_26940 [Mycolicibacterium sarraceniae]|uniref:NADP-dependent oxidoreductase domain-containing protein n=2 Tax=Mycolicibacterium sarraceniae TaxID=1534348 RepID=A0A7I7SRW7_9MYCO|nr:hypothetical protein MSAR_26940 [Mycolicibacterium sarraceniae]